MTLADLLDRMPEMDTIELSSTFAHRRFAKLLELARLERKAVRVMKHGTAIAVVVPLDLDGNIRVTEGPGLDRPGLE